MLSAAHRLTDAEQFRAASRRGQRASSPTVVTHLLVPDPTSDLPSQVGFVVSKAIGDAVRRNRTKRRLRHLVRGRLGELDGHGGGAVLVVRAKPAAAGASYAALGADLDRCLDRCLGESTARAGRAQARATP